MMQVYASRVVAVSDDAQGSRDARGAVLVADDDGAIRALVHAILRRAMPGVEIDDATSGNDAMLKIRKKRYDSIILDLMMGDGDGHDVLQMLAIDRPGDKCVVVMSAASTKVIQAVDSENVLATLRKPFDISEFVSAVQQCFDQ